MKCGVHFEVWTESFNSIYRSFYFKGLSRTISIENIRSAFEIRKQLQIVAKKQVGRLTIRKMY
jgi:hypothetical protein